MFRKYKAVLDRFVEFLPPNADPRKVTRDDLTDFMVRLKNKHKLDVVHLFWSDINLNLNTIRVTSKSELRF